MRGVVVMEGFDIVRCDAIDRTERLHSQYLFVEINFPISIPLPQQSLLLTFMRAWFESPSRAVRARTAIRSTHTGTLPSRILPILYVHTRCILAYNATENHGYNTRVAIVARFLHLFGSALL
jgi:hypothetical protein